MLLGLLRCHKILLGHSRSSLLCRGHALNLLLLLLLWKLGLLLILVLLDRVERLGDLAQDVDDLHLRLRLLLLLLHLLLSVAISYSSSGLLLKLWHLLRLIEMLLLGRHNLLLRLRQLVNRTKQAFHGLLLALILSRCSTRRVL